MRIHKPPEIEEKYFLDALKLVLEKGIKPVDEKGRYLHWNDLKHRVPNNIDPIMFWHAVKFTRMQRYKILDTAGIDGKPFCYAPSPNVEEAQHYMDSVASGQIKSQNLVTNPETRKTFLVRSLIEEAITSSQLEGASTTTAAAKEMLRENRSPRDKDERMIFNNYRAMEYVKEIANDELTLEKLLTLHRIVTEGTLDDQDKAGVFRTDADNVSVVDNRTGDILFKPAAEADIPERMEKLLAFANCETMGSGTFLHPLIKSICLHFFLAYEHPFVDGNGRTARALFYWSMIRHGYWLTEYLSISKMIKKSPMGYARAFLHVETDDNDLTYFIENQLTFIRKSVAELYQYLEQKQSQIIKWKEIIEQNTSLAKGLNFRQQQLLRHALKNPRFVYRVREHQQSHGVAYETARNDLNKLVDLKLLIKVHFGKADGYMVTDDLQYKLSTTKI